LLIIVFGSTGGDSTGLFMESNDNGCCTFIKWLRAGTSSSTILDEVIRES
jgi:hypothetical protein